MSAEDAINILLQNHPKGFDLSLDRVTALLEKVGSPQHKIPPVFHIAGTNGKGSTAAFLRSILESSGKSVHVHTSPHLVNWYERYRLGKAGGGKFVSDAVLEEAVTRVSKANNGKPITVFEVMSAVGFLLFSEHEADYTILEVGLGGRFDATNVISKPAISLITPIALDHQSYLGDTIEEIAFEKAGIIKTDTPVVIGSQSDAVRDVLEDIAKSRNAEIKISGQDFDAYEQAGRFIYQDEDGLLDLPLPRLSGDHQISNAALAIAAMRTLGLNFTTEIYEAAMTKVSWPGRFERLPHGKLLSGLPEETHNNLDIWIDGGHNPQAGAVVAKELADLEERLPMPLVMIVGMLTTKDPSGFFDVFDGLVSEVLTVPIQESEAGFSAEELAQKANLSGLNAKPSPSIEQALTDIAKRYGNELVRVMICGSLYLVGEVLELNETPPE